ncbi:MAG: hypothetical protein RL368_1912 [Pseudomonadota bacterium]|jgi:mRNA interferase YafO
MGTHSVVKISRHLKEFAEYEKLAEAFRQYKVEGKTPSFLGRDAAYNYLDTPPLIKQFLWHIHICIPLHQHPLLWKRIADIFRRTNHKNAPERDYALIYCYDELQDIYYLLTIIGPDAHNMKRWQSYLRDVALQAEQLLTRSAMPRD